MPDHTPDTADLVMQVHLVPVNRQQGTVGVALTIPLKRRDLAPIAFAKMLGDNMPSLIKEYQDKNPAPDVLELKANPLPKGDTKLRCAFCFAVADPYCRNETGDCFCGAAHRDKFSELKANA